MNGMDEKNGRIDGNELIELASSLISAESVSPRDCGCQDLLINKLAPCGFEAEDMTFADTRNTWLRYGTEKPLFCFAGHVDVVPPGNTDAWEFPPFSPVVKDGYLCGRGAADMKGSVAAFTIASREFVKNYPDFKGSLALLITSDEEADFVNGTVRVVDALEARGETIDYCIVGEPSCAKSFGDTMRIGRRGSITANVVLYGIQGHVANPTAALNPIHASLTALGKLVSYKWDSGNERFPPSSMQIPNIAAGTGANNVIPGELKVQINWRFCPETTVEKIKSVTENILAETGLRHEINWSFSGNPFLSEVRELVSCLGAAVKDKTGIEPELSTGGGTSDGRFIARIAKQIVEFGPINATIHKANEKVSSADLLSLAEIYYDTLCRIFKK